MSRIRMDYEERRQQIKSATKKILLKKGFRNTVMDDIMQETKLSRGGLYHHYNSVSEILYEIMADGNKTRDAIIEDTLTLKKDLPFNELAAEIIVEKMLAENELVSIYAMFLQEIRYDEKLKKLYEKLKTESIQSISRLFEGQNREAFKNYSELIADLINSVILSCEILHTRANFSSNKEVLKRMIIESLKQSKDLD